MDEGFELPVILNGKDLKFPGQLHLYGYTQKIEIKVYGTSVMFERDEERNWRAIVDPSQLDTNKSITTELIQAVAESIDHILS
jgi:hypothetical protein